MSMDDIDAVTTWDRYLEDEDHGRRVRRDGPLVCLTCGRYFYPEPAAYDDPPIVLRHCLACLRRDQAGG